MRLGGFETLDIAEIPDTWLDGPALIGKAAGSLDMGSVLPPSPKNDPVPVEELLRHTLGTEITKLLNSSTADGVTGFEEEENDGLLVSLVMRRSVGSRVAGSGVGTTGER